MSELEVYIIGPEWGMPSMSPFGSKLATWVRMAGIQHDLRVQDDPRKGPKKKSPWIVDGAVAMGDSQLIIEHLERTRGVDPNAHLDAQQRATAHLLRRTFEEHFHDVTEYAMFCLDQGWQQSKAHFDFLPALVRPFLLPIIRSSTRKESWVKGLARHTPDEMARIAADDLRAAAALLGDKPYFFGDRPVTVDCTMFGFLGITLWAPIPYFAQEELVRHANLVSFCERMRERYWSEMVDGPEKEPPSPAAGLQK